MNEQQIDSGNYYNHINVQARGEREAVTDLLDCFPSLEIHD